MPRKLESLYFQGVLLAAALLVVPSGLYFFSQHQAGSPPRKTNDEQDDRQHPKEDPRHHSKDNLSCSPLNHQEIGSVGSFCSTAPHAHAHISAALETFHAFLQSYSALSPDRLCTFLSPRFTHELCPASMNLPTRDREAFRAHATRVFDLFESFRIYPYPRGSAGREGPGGAGAGENEDELTVVGGKMRWDLVYFCGGDGEMEVESMNAGNGGNGANGGDDRRSKDMVTVIAHCKMGGKVNPHSATGKALIEAGLTEWWNECVLFAGLEEVDKEGGVNGHSSAENGRNGANGNGNGRAESNGTGAPANGPGAAEPDEPTFKIRELREFVDSHKASELRVRLDRVLDE